MHSSFSAVQVPARFALTASILLLASFASGFGAEDPPAKKLNVLFLGDKGHHVPIQRFGELKEALTPRGIELTYTGNDSDLNPETLAKYDALVLYSNSLAIEPSEEKALLDFVSNGKGFVPIHCASACFRNSPKFIELVGASFKSHHTGVFGTTVAAPDHPIMKGFKPFETWDETYVHDNHNPDRVVLQTRTEGTREEPWTWTRSVGKGRVFYTAYGHDERTWTNPGFLELIERGIRWSTGDDKVSEHVKPYPRNAATASAPTPASREQIELAKLQPKRTDVKPFEFAAANVPFYSPSGRSGGADGWNKMQQPLDPAESQKHLVLPEGFEAQLFAAEPDIVKPITMAWDHKGRLWVAETVDYPNNKLPDGEGHDRIKICEDTDGDGRADKFTIFADKLSIPTSITFANGGIVVQQAPGTLFLKSTKDDDHCDERRVLFSGWGVSDTHAGPSNLRWGFDNWIWGIVGYSSFSGTVNGEALKFGAGFYRFKPDGSKLEFLRSNNNNSWGLGFSEEGIVFGSTANGNSNVYLPIPNRYYEAVRGGSSSVLRTIADSIEIHPVTDRVRQVDWHGKFTAAAGSALYTARTYPKEYWNRATFVNEPTGHVTATFLLERNGSDFIARNTPSNLVSSDDEWTAPIFADVGPDGNVWVIDWYNYIVQHNPTPRGWKNGKGNAYDTDLRDKTHGRIYRIVYKGGKQTPPLKLDPKDGPGLVAALKNENMFWRMTAQRLLVERGNPDVVPDLIRLTQEQALDGAGLTPCAIHALWAMHGLGALDGKNASATASAVAALKHPCSGVRRNAVQVLPRDNASTQALLASGVLSDADAQVRLVALLALSEMPRSEAAAEALIGALADAKNLADAWIPDALTVAAAAHDLQFLKAISGKKLASSDDKKVVEIVARVSESYARSNPADSVGSLIAVLAGAQPKIQEALIAGLARGWPKAAPLKLDDAAETALGTLMTEAAPGAKGYLSALAQRWGSQVLRKRSAEIAAALLLKLQNNQTPDAEKQSLAVQLMELRKDDVTAAAELIKLITPRASPEFDVAILDAIRQSEAPATGAILVENLQSFPPSAQQTVRSMLLEKTEWTRALLQGIEAGKAQLNDFSLDQKQALASVPDKDIAALAKKLLAQGGGMPDADRQKVIDELTPVVMKKGDPAKGKEIFKANCMKCHTHSGEGAKIGPELTGMAAHPKSELLIAILDPSRDVEGNYKQYMVATTEGQRYVGLLASESKTSVEILDAEGKTHPIQRDNIKKMVASPKSLMPDGFEKQIKPEDLANLLEFLTQRGKYLQLDLRKVATAVSTKGMFTNRQNQAERLVFPDWKPKTFEGVPFMLVDPQVDRVNNVVMLYSPHTAYVSALPKAVVLPCNSPAKAIHFLSGVSGWGAQRPGTDGSVSLIVRLHFMDGKTEDIPLKNGVHFADYIGHFDVPESKLAFKLDGQQIRYFAVHPQSNAVIKEIELKKGPDDTAPVVMAVTVEPGE